MSVGQIIASVLGLYLGWFVILLIAFVIYDWIRWGWKSIEVGYWVADAMSLALGAFLLSGLIIAAILLW